MVCLRLARSRCPPPRPLLDGSDGRLDDRLRAARRSDRGSARRPAQHRAVHALRGDRGGGPGAARRLLRADAIEGATDGVCAHSVHPVWARKKGVGAAVRVDKAECAPPQLTPATRSTGVSRLAGVGGRHERRRRGGRLRATRGDGAQVQEHRHRLSSQRG
eukprot:scaffold113860_cov51-Phaeocystis_antarctica.AAC.1